MQDKRNYYVLCENNCKFPAMTAEQTMAAIAEATGNTPTNIDDAFITKIKEKNANNNLTFWVGTTAQYNALVAAGEIDENCLCILTDETTNEEIVALHDTGWVKHQDGLNFRLKNGIAYIAFAAVNTKQTPARISFELPFKLENNISGGVTLAAVKVNTSGEYSPLMFYTAYNKANKITTVTSAEEINTDETVELTFSFPYSEYDL